MRDRFGATMRDNTKQPHYLLRDEISGVVVSTIDMLALSHGNVELIGCMGYRYETMIFGGTHDQDQNRYGREDEARVGHAIAVAKVKAAQP